MPVSSSVTITSPNSVANWESPSTQTITWTKQVGDDHTVLNFVLQLYKDGSYNSAIASGISASATSYSWSIPSGLSDDDDYQVYIKMNYVEDEGE